jgi:hypothetical protein
VRVLRSVVQSFVLAMLNAGHDLPLRRAVTAKLVGYRHARRPRFFSSLRSSCDPGVVHGSPHGPMLQRPPSDRLPNRFQRLRTSRRQEESAIATAMPDRLSRTKGVAETVKRLNRKVATPVRILMFASGHLVHAPHNPPL